MNLTSCEKNWNYANYNKKYMVQIKTWNRGSEENKWNVYCYLYPGHPLCNSADAQSILNDYFHWGITFEHIRREGNGIITTVQLGSDYEHLDDDYSHCSELFQVPEIVADAKILYDFLENVTQTEANASEKGE